MNSMKKNLLYVYIVNLINGLAGIAFIPLALNKLGAEGYGIYSIFIILTSYVYFVEMGVAKYFTRKIAQTVLFEEHKKNIQIAVGVYIRIAIILVAITPALIYVVPHFIFPIENIKTLEIIVFLATLDYLLSIPTTIQLTFNIGKENFQKISKFNLISGLSKHFTLILAILLTNSVLLIILVILIRRIIDIFYARKYLEGLPKESWKPKYIKGEFNRILSESILLSTAQLAQVTILAIGTILVNKNFSIKEVGIYKSAFDLATKVWFFSNSLGLVVFPRFSAMLANKLERALLFKKIPLYNNISWLFYHIVFLIIFYILPLLPNILQIDNMNLFFLLLYGVCLNAHTNLSYEFLIAYSKLKESIWSNIIALFFIFVMFYWLIEHYGLYAIGIAWILSQLIYSVLMDFFVLNKINKRITFVTLFINLFIVILCCIILI